MSRYSGQFSEGLYSGEGTLYYESGVKKYVGNFTEGMPNGSGTLYDRDGEILYTGSFANGMKNGTGKLYKNGIVIAKGMFEDDKFVEGTGIVFDDEDNIIYEGKLAEGLYEGKGILYDPETGNVVYAVCVLSDSDNDWNFFLGHLFEAVRKSVPYLGIGEPENESQVLLHICQAAMENRLRWLIGLDHHVVAVHSGLPE